MEIVYYSTYPKSKTAFHDIIPSLRASDPEVVFMLDSGQTAGILASQIRYHEMFRTILFGLSAWNDEFLIQIGGGSLEGSFFVSEYPDHSPARIRISSEFKNKFGEYPDAFALRAFEAVYLFSNGVITGGATTRYHLHRYLKQSKELPGLDGPAFFSDTQNLST